MRLRLLMSSFGKGYSKEHKANRVLNIAIRPQAQDDIDAIIDYLLAERPPSAQDFVQRLRQTFELLAENPKIGVQRPYRAEALNGMRMFSLKQFSAYLVFYLHDDEAIDIVRVLHGSRDIAGIISCFI